jgi:hypothetical protein
MSSPSLVESMSAARPGRELTRGERAEMLDEQTERTTPRDSASRADAADRGQDPAQLQALTGPDNTRE